MAQSDHTRHRCHHRAHPIVGSIGLLLIVAMAAFVILPGCTSSESTCPPKQPADQKPEPSPAAGKLPQLDLQPLTGDSRPVTLAELEGRVVLVNFWGPWCPPCQVEFPHIAEIERKFRDNPDFKLFAVSCTYEMREDPTALRSETSEFLQQLDTDMPTYVDPVGTTRLAAQSVGAFNDAYPTTLLLDRQGGIRKAWEGYVPGYEKEMEKLITELLEEK